MMNTKSFRTATVVAAALSVLATAGSPMVKADNSMMSTPKMAMSHKMAMHKTVYVCTTCKAYYSPTAAKKMGYKDAMGHKLTKMSSVPSGYSDGSKMGSKMGAKMDSGSKM